MRDQVVERPSGLSYSLKQIATRDTSQRISRVRRFNVRAHPTGHLRNPHKGVCPFAPPLPERTIHRVAPINRSVSIQFVIYDWIVSTDPSRPTVLFEMTQHSQMVPSIIGHMPTSESTIISSVPERPVTSVSASRSAFWARMISRAEDTGVVFSYHVRRGHSSDSASAGVVQWIADKEVDRRDLFESDTKEGFTGLWKSFIVELHKGVFESAEMPAHFMTTYGMQTTEDSANVRVPGMASCLIVHSYDVSSPHVLSLFRDDAVRARETTETRS